MIEDKLPVEQRLRLECIAQANLTHGAGLGRPVNVNDVLDAASGYESWIRDGNRGTAKAPKQPIG